MTPGFRRALAELGITRGSPRWLSVGATIRSLSNATELPGTADIVTAFAPGQAHVRRLRGYNLWLLYRFDDLGVALLTMRAQPPVPEGEASGSAQ